MLLNLNVSELLEYRRTMAGLEPALLDFTVERMDGIDISHIIAMRLRNWYLNLLDTAPAALLPVRDVASQAIVAPGQLNGTSIVTLPDGARRPVAIRMAGWNTAVPVLGVECLDRVVLLQNNPFTAATASYPIAVADAASITGVLVFPSAQAVQQATAVMDPGEGTFILDESLIASMPLENFFSDL